MKGPAAINRSILNYQYVVLLRGVPEILYPSSGVLR